MKRGGELKRTPLARGTTPLKRKVRKRRAPGTGCQVPKCRRLVYRTLDVRRCAKHAADKIVGDWVKARDDGCIRCGSEGPLDWAHVVSRRYSVVRWYVAWQDGLDWARNNSVAFCRPCHYWQTMHPLEGKAFFRSIGIDVDAIERFAIGGATARTPEQIVEAFEPAPTHDGKEPR